MEGKTFYESKDKRITGMESTQGASPVSPIKHFGKVSIGFRSFKLINSNIKLVKQVDVKTSVIKQKMLTPQSPSSNHIPPVPSSQLSCEPVPKISTADALKKIREKIQQRKVQQDELDVVDVIGEVSPKNVSSPPGKNGLKISPVKRHVAGCTEQVLLSSPNHITNHQKTTIASSKSQSKDSKDRKYSPNKKNSSNQSSSSHRHSHRHDEFRKTREKSRSPRHKKSPDRSTRSRNSSSSSSRHKSSHSHRHSPSKSRRSSRSRSRGRAGSHFHRHHSEKQRSRDSNVTKTKRDKPRQHRSRELDSKQANAPSKDGRNMSAKLPSEDGVSAMQSFEDFLSEASVNDHDNVSQKSTESEYATRSACSSMESEAEVCITSPVADRATDRSDGDGIFSRLSTAFSKSDSVAIESSGEQNTERDNLSEEIDQDNCDIFVTNLQLDFTDDAETEDCATMIDEGNCADESLCQPDSTMEDEHHESELRSLHNDSPSTKLGNWELSPCHSNDLSECAGKKHDSSLECDHDDTCDSEILSPKILSRFASEQKPDCQWIKGSEKSSETDKSDNVQLNSYTNTAVQIEDGHDNNPGKAIDIPDQIPSKHSVKAPKLTVSSSNSSTSLVTSTTKGEGSLVSEDWQGDFASTSHTHYSSSEYPSHSLDESSNSPDQLSECSNKCDSTEPPVKNEDSIMHEAQAYPVSPYSNSLIPDSMKDGDIPLKSTSFLNKEKSPTSLSISSPSQPCCSGTPSDSPPLTPPTRDNEIIPTQIEEDDARLLHLSPTKSLTDSKIPTLVSKLNNVFQSILHTDFSTAGDVDEKAAATKLNGIRVAPLISMSSQLNASSLEEDSETAPTPPICDTNTVTDRKNSKVQDMDYIEAPEKKHDLDHANDYQKCDDSHLKPGYVTPPHVADLSPVKANHVSPGNKLTLHATTKTPLPAKKSYIQQAQMNREIDTPFQFQPISLGQAFGELGPEISKSIVTSTDLESHPEALESVGQPNHDEVENSLPVQSADFSEEQPEKWDLLDSNNENEKIIVSETGLLRQDSSGSSPADTDDGLRRSARIRTKKNERTRTVHRAKFTNTNSDPGVAEVGQRIRNDPDTEVQGISIVTAQCQSDQQQIERFPNQLSEEDVFKVKIRLACGIDDMPQKFDVLDENLYLTTKKKSRARKEIRRMVCDCGLEEMIDSEAPCGENCLNRLLMIECSSRCHFGDHCTNKRFQQRLYCPTEVFKTSFKGWGIRASDDISANQLIMEYCGEVVDQREFTLRSLEYSESNHAHFYFMALSQDEVIDATYKGNASRFINHSCDPNAETQKWTVNGRLRVGFFTLRDIPKGEEITFDYQFERYGKVAQKCYCGTSKCRGYLGKAPDEDDKKSKSSKKSSLTASFDEILEEGTGALEQEEKDRRKAKKKLSLFDDMMEKDLSKLLGGLRSSKEVLTLSRLMVRCDTHSQRVLCLRVLNETTSQTRLKTFLQFHGLSIIWSWMVDIGGSEEEETQPLKLDIISTLRMLPINNRNIIEDSKILSVVQRWAKNGSEMKASPDDENDGSGSENKKSPTDDTRDNADQGEESKEMPDVEKPVATITSVCPQTMAADDKNVMNVLTGDGCEKPDVVEEIESEKVTTAAESLLDSWKNLREIYRIPKRQKPVSSPDHESSSRDNSHSRTSSPSSKRAHNDDHDPRSNWHGRSWRESSQERWDNSDRGWDNDRSWYRDRKSDSRDQRSSPSHHGNDTRLESARRKRRFSTDSDDLSSNGKHVPWHCRAPQGSRMSRQEHRKKFEKDVRKREQEKKRRVEEVPTQMDPLMTPNISIPVNSQSFMQDMQIGGQSSVTMGQDLSAMAQQLMPGNTQMGVNNTFTQSGYSGNLIQINPAPQPQLVMQSYVDQGGNPQMGVMSHVMNVMQQPQNQYMQIPVQQDYTMQGMYTQDQNLHVGMQGTYSISNPILQPQQQVDGMGRHIITSGVGVMQTQSMQSQVMQVQQQPLMQVNQQPTVQQQPAAVQMTQQPSNVTILGSQNGQAIVLLSAEQLQKLTQGQQPVPVLQQAQPEPAQVQSEPVSSTTEPQSVTAQNSSSASSSATHDNTADNKSSKLPPNWKIATDAEGRIYYYHIITRQTQWDPPTWDGKLEDMLGKKEAEMDVSSTPTHDERRQKSKTRSNEKITEEGKKAKESFRLKMSQFVVQCLSAFRKKDCRVGRITSTEDFKHLARKLTHNIMLKEIKQVRVWEDLDFNANVRHKTKEYVRKYMSRVGPIYRIRDDNPMDPS